MKAFIIILLIAGMAAAATTSNNYGEISYQDIAVGGNLQQNCIIATSAGTVYPCANCTASASVQDQTSHVVVTEGVMQSIGNGAFTFSTAQKGLKTGVTYDFQTSCYDLNTSKTGLVQSTFIINAPKTLNTPSITETSIYDFGKCVVQGGNINTCAEQTVGSTYASCVLGGGGALKCAEDTLLSQYIRTLLDRLSPFMTGFLKIVEFIISTVLWMVQQFLFIVRDPQGYLNDIVIPAVIDIFIYVIFANFFLFFTVEAFIMAISLMFAYQVRGRASQFWRFAEHIIKYNAYIAIVLVNIGYTALNVSIGIFSELLHLIQTPKQMTPGAV